MPVRGNEPNRKRKRKRTRTRTRTRTNKREDRLSSLPDDILIKILSRLPLQLVVTTGCLSWRWSGLWTNVTSIHINSCKFNYLRLDNIFTRIITRTTSPLIHSFIVDFGEVKIPRRSLNYSWLRQICDRNVRVLKVTNSSYCYDNIRHQYMVRSRFALPSFIFVTQSLVSIELDSTFNLRLPDNGDPINLPNLKKLHLCYASMDFESLEKLIKACLSLEELSFDYSSCFSFIHARMLPMPLRYIKFSHQNLQRLLIKNLPYNYRVVLNVPQLKYMAILTSKSVAFRFEEEPMMSCAVEIDSTDFTDYGCTLTEDEITSVAKFYGLFHNVTILTPDVFIHENLWPLNMFCNATQLTLSMNTSYNINTLLAILELCPVLDALTLQMDTDGMERAAEMPGHVSTWQRALKKLKIETECNTNGKTTKFLVELVEYFLSKSVDLKYFHVTVDSSYHKMGSTKGAQIREMKLCKLLYQCPILSAGCEVEFVGRFYKMSRKAGLKIWIANGKDIPMN